MKKEGYFIANERNKKTSSLREEVGEVYKINHRFISLMQSKKAQFWLFLVVLAVMALCMMFSFYPLRAAYDFNFHYNRLYIIIQALENGSFPFYMDNNVLNGYGYFTKVFYPDLALLPFAAIGYFTSLYVAYQSLIFTMTFLCGMFTYIAVNKIYRNSFAAAVGSILFTFVIYRLFDIYLRGALGESIAFTFMPLVSWGVYEIVKGNYKKWYILTIASFLLINTHILSTILIFIFTTLFLAIYFKSFIKEPERLKYLLIAGGATLITCSYFIMPFLEQLHSNTFWVTSKPWLNFNHEKMTMSTIIYGVFSFLDPRAKTGALLTALICLRFFIKSDKSERFRSIDYSLIAGCICVIACWIYFPWNVFPFTLLHFIQFPWRLFQIAVYFFAIAGGFYASFLLSGNTKGKIFFFTFLVVISCISFKVEFPFTPANRIITETTMDFPKTVVGGEYLPAKVPSVKYIEERGDTITRRHSETTASRFARQKDGLSFRLNTNQKETLELPLLYYKGYRAELDGQELGLRESPNGLVEITAGKSGEVNVYYAGTVIQKISVWLTLLSLLALIGYVVWSRKINNISQNRFYSFLLYK